MTNVKKICLFAIWSISLWGGLSAKEINNYRWRYSVNIPADWLPVTGDDSGRIQIFRSLDLRLSLEIQAWERREVESARSLYLNHLRKLSGSGIVSRYNHMGYEVLLARIAYDSVEVQEYRPAAEEYKGGQDTRRRDFVGNLDTVVDELGGEQDAEPNTAAYVFYFYGARYAYRVSSIAPRNISVLEKNLQHSVLDSFGFEGHNNWNWGPVSSFFIYQKKLESQKQQESNNSRRSSSIQFTTWSVGSHQFRAAIDPIAEQVAQDVLERERKILRSYDGKLYPYALARFYTLMFRQNYSFLKDLAISLQKSYLQNPGTGETADQPDFPDYEYLLYDLQEMLLHSGRSTAASANVPLDLPSKALAKGEGNLETLALIYAIVNSHFQHNSLILYSPAYSQLLVGAEEFYIDEEGLRKRYNQDDSKFKKYAGIAIAWYTNRYLIGELTDRIYMGWARVPLRDLRKWIPLAFPRYVRPGTFP